jgi:hypothetical protein
VAKGIFRRSFKLTGREGIFARPIADGALIHDLPRTLQTGVIRFFRPCVGGDMKNSNAVEFSRSEDSTLSFKALKPEDLNSLLLSFYLSLDFDARRARFGGGLSDDAIRQHCRQLDPNRTIVLACSGPAGLLAAIELHALSFGWGDVELAIAECAATDQRTIIAQLLQLAAFAAGERGCSCSILSPEEWLARTSSRDGPDLHPGKRDPG